MFFMTDIILFMTVATLKMLVPFLFIFEGPEAAKAVIDLEWDDVSLVKKLWEQTFGE